MKFFKLTGKKNPKCQKFLHMKLLKGICKTHYVEHKNIFEIPEQDTPFIKLINPQMSITERKWVKSKLLIAVVQRTYIISTIIRKCKSTS